MSEVPHDRSMRAAWAPHVGARVLCQRCSEVEEDNLRAERENLGGELDKDLLQFLVIFNTFHI